jgi:hypothetical protein
MLDPVLKFDSNGTLVAHFGADSFCRRMRSRSTRTTTSGSWTAHARWAAVGGRGGAGRGADSAGAGRAAAPPALPRTQPRHQAYKFSPTASC